MNLLISEILDKVEAAKTKEEKLNLLKQYNTPLLRTIMRLNFDPDFNMDLPEGEPPYKKEPDKPIGMTETNLQKEFRRFYIWLTPQDLPRMRKEALFIQLLEGIHQSEADILVLAKDKKLHKKYKSLTEKLIREAYPITLPAKKEERKAETPPLV